MSAKKPAPEKPPVDELGMSDDQIAQNTWDRFSRALDSHDEWAEDAEKFENFFAGEQWDEEDLAKLKEQGRPALTINLIKPAVMAIVGEQQKTRADITFKPRNSRADQETANVLSQLVQYIDSDTMYGDIESQVFFDGCLTDRGFIDVRMGFERNLSGDIVMTADNPKQVVLDPDCRSYDPDEWPGVFETYWRSLDYIENTYGKDAADKLRVGAALDIGYVDTSTSIRWKDDRIARTGSETAPDAVAADGTDRYIEAIRVIEHQYFVYRNAWVFIDPVTGDIIDPRCDLPKEMLEQQAQERGLQLTEMPRRRVRWRVVAHNVVLFNAWSAYPFLTKAGVFPIWLRGRPIGIVRDMISPQEQLNKVESQELHVINTTANSGWIYEDGSILNMEDEEIEQNGAETGLVLKVRKGAGFPPQKIQPNQIPAGLAHKAAKNVDYLRFISMVNDAMLGFSGPEVSGVALDAKKESGITAFVPAFQNLKRTRNIIAKRILWLIQNFYTQPRMVRITDYAAPERPDVDVAVNVPDATGNILNNVTVGRYDVVVSSAPARDTHEDGQFAQMMEMRNAGVMVPDDEVVRRSDLSEKFPLAERIAQLQGTAQPSEQEVQINAMLQQLEMQKMQLEVGKMEAEVLNLQAQAELNAAKAIEIRAKVQAGGGDEGVNAEMLKVAVERERIATEANSKREALMAQMETARLQAQTKIQIAQMQVGVKQDSMLHQSALKRAQEGNKTMDTQRKERNDQATLAFKAMMQNKQIEADKQLAKENAKAKAAAAKKQPAKKKS